MDRVGDERTTPREQNATQPEAPIYIRTAGSHSAVIEPAPVPEPAATLPSPVSSDLPEAPPAADLARSTIKPRYVLLIFGLTFLVYGVFVNRFIRYSSPPTGDQPFYLMVTISIVQDGDLNLANNFANRDEDKFYALAPHPSDFVGMGAPYPLPPHNAFSTARPPEEQYNFHWPGLSIMLIPAWVIGGMFNLWWPATVLFMCIIGALVSTNIILLAHEITGRTWIAVAVWAALAFTSPIMTYSYMIFTELSCGLLLIYAFRRLALGWGANGPVRLFMIGFSIAYIPWLAFRCAPISAGLFLYAVVQWIRYYRANKAPTSDEAGAAQTVTLCRHILQAGWLLAPLIVSGVLLYWHNTFLYGSIMPGNQSSERGDLPLFLWPWEGREELTRFFSSGYGMLFDRVFGLVSFAPVYLLAAVGVIAMLQSRRRNNRRLFFFMALVSAPYLFMIMSFFYWNGLWCPPARFLTTFAPLFAAPLAVSLFACKSWIYRGLYTLMAIPGFLVMAIMLLDPRRFWPADPPYEWLAHTGYLGGDPPIHVNIPIWDILPAIDPPFERDLPVNTAWVTIASLAIIVLGYMLMTRWRREQGTRHLPFAAQGLVWVAVVAAASGSWFISNFDYIKHKTELVEVQRIGANPGLAAARGIEYLDGKVYVTDPQSKVVGVFDLASKSYSQWEAMSDGTPVPFAGPGDIKEGPNNELYLLNNGDNDDALFVMKPDGTIVRRLALGDKTPVADGLYVGPDGSIYVADVVGGGIQKYGPDGGVPLARYTGQRTGFNNVIDVLVTQDGKIYAAESSYKVVQEMAPDGTYIRSINVGCQPYYMASNNDDWIEVSCPEKGIFSIDRKSGAVQFTKTSPDTAMELNAPTGMAYGPDGKLYVINGNTLLVYEVRH
ncbi:MAG: hypothetical protein ABI670_10455 [Chloroflexota bacterium]